MRTAPKVLVTGGAGFIGCALGSSLVRNGHEVVVIDSLHPQVHPGGRRPSSLVEVIPLHHLDITEPGAIESVLVDVRPEVIVHLAAETGTGQSLTEATRHGLVNVVGTTRLLDAMTATGQRPRHLVLTSSRAVYGEGTWKDAKGTVFHPVGRVHDDLASGRWDPLAESRLPASPVPSEAGSTPAQPANVYAATKLAQEHLLTAWASAMGPGVSILRLQNVYGPGQSVTNSYTGVLTLFARLAAAGRPIEVYEDGRIIRDFVYIDDVVSAIAAAIDRPPSGVRRLDIGSGRASELIEVAVTMAGIAGSPSPFVSGKFRDGDIRAASCRIDAAIEQLDYRPRWQLHDGLAELLTWVRRCGDDGGSPGNVAAPPV